VAKIPRGGGGGGGVFGYFRGGAGRGSMGGQEERHIIGEVALNRKKLGEGEKPHSPLKEEKL